MMKGLIIAISGPSGVGKGTVCSKVISRLDNVAISVSATTRAPRNGEIHGKHYYFYSKDEFLKLVRSGGLAEYAEIVGNMYGTPKAPMLKQLESGKDVLLEIDIKGVHQVVKNMDDCLTIFLLPPSTSELEKRLRGRNSETEEQIQHRLNLAKEEIASSGNFDYQIINNNVDETVDKIINIINVEKTKRGKK